MTGRDERPSREDVVYGTIAAYLRRYAAWIVVLAPLALISLVPMGPAGVLVVMVIYLNEAIVYAAVRRRRQGIRKGPGPALQALWAVLATLLIIGGLVGLSASGAIAAVIAIVIGMLIVGWVWARVARASGESTPVFVARIGRQILQAAGRAILFWWR
jgi:hypothetical protein